MISVIIPLYNKEAIIERTLRSVLSQDYDDYEVVIVDDGSTDRSAEIVRSITDDRIRFYSQENGGPSKARNMGVKLAKGEWLVFLDADDELLPGALSLFDKLSTQHYDADVIDCCMDTKIDGVVLHNQKSFVGYCKNPLEDLYFNKIEPGANETLFKKSLCEKYPYNEKYRRYEDMDFVIRALKSATVYSSDKVVAIVNAGYASASKARKDLSDDYIGHMTFKGNFWQRMIQYRLYLGERDYYKEECRRLYPLLQWRYDLLLLYKILNKIYR